MSEALTTSDVIRAAIPDADDALCSHILWGRTPYPMGTITARGLYKAASGFARAGANNRRLCDHCHREALSGKWECQRCQDVLEAARNNE